MDITTENFTEYLPQILSAIDSADFISVDVEFTGLRNGVDVTAYDTPSEYYTKLRDGSLNFLPIQIGICTFKFNASKKKYVYKALNFYVFPRPMGKINNDTNFLCQASSINFLSNSGFNFNKLFQKGIPYLTITEEESLQNELTTKYDNINDTEPHVKVPVPKEHAAAIEDICKRIETFLQPESGEKELYIDKCNGFMRKLVFQTAYERFSTQNFSLSTKWLDNNIYLVAQKGKSKAEQDKENLERERNEIRKAVGFSEIIKYISEKKKLIIGHNMLLDVCHIINRFCWPLPENYFEFKDMVRQLFTRIIDTKYMCNVYPFKDLIPSSVMDHMIKQLHEPPFHFPEAEAESEEFGYKMDENKAHEAGYDAYITGLAFIALTSYLNKKSEQTATKLDLEMLKPFENRLFLMRIMDYSFINLKGEEPVPKRNHVFHITFPKEWKTNDIVKLFTPYGGIHVSYCNQTTAWVTLLDANESERVVSELIGSNLATAVGLRQPYSVVTWRTFELAKRLNSANPSSTDETAANKTNKKDDEARPNEFCGPPRKKKKASTTSVTDARDTFQSSNLKYATEKKPLESEVCETNLTLGHSKNDGNELQKTFEEPSWK